VTATGTGTVTLSGSVTHITAFGADLALIGQSAGSFSTFTETAPLRSGGTYTLS
jgi:carboxylesterase type B